MLSGRKKWILYPPDVVLPGVQISGDNTEISTPTSLIKWFRDFYQHTKVSVVKFWAFFLILEIGVGSWGLGTGN